MSFTNHSEQNSSTSTSQQPSNQATLETKFPVMEIFGPTIQGEGGMIGEKTHFIRFGGCDYRCIMCDSMHAVDPPQIKDNAKWLTAEEILHEVLSLGEYRDTPWVTISGGNPAIHDLSHVVAMLRLAGYKIAVETQGSIWRDWLVEVDYLTICPKGPGMGERFDPEVFQLFLTNVVARHNSYSLIVGIKVVVFSQQDFEFAVGIDEILFNLPAIYRSKLFPKSNRYLSLGNPFPPGKDTRIDSTTLPMDRDELGGQLLEEYEMLLEDYLKDKRLSHWKFLPQLHVLIYGNKQGV